MSEIWVPPKKLQTITLYADETYFHRNTGAIQVALPMVESGIDALTEALAPVLEAQQGAELKAGKISSKNVERYRTFLRYVINIAAEMGTQAPLYPVITLESTDQYQGHEFNRVKQQMEGAIAKLRLSSRAVTEFSKQALWLWRYLKDICPQGAANPFEMIFDAKYRDAEECGELKPLMSFLGVPVLQEHWKQLTSFLNTALPLMKPKRWAPKVERFQFIKSEDHIALQAADLLSNVFYNEMQFESGIVTDNTRLKHDLFVSVFDGPLDSAVLSELDVVVETNKLGEQRQLLVCKPGLKGKMVLKS